MAPDHDGSGGALARFVASYTVDTLPGGTWARRAGSRRSLPPAAAGEHVTGWAELRPGGRTRALRCGQGHGWGAGREPGPMAAPGQTRGRTGRTGRLPWHRTMTVGITVLLFLGGGRVRLSPPPGWETRKSRPIRGEAQPGQSPGQRGTGATARSRDRPAAGCVTPATREPSVAFDDRV